MSEDEVEPEPEGPPTLVDRLLPPVDPKGEDGHPKPTRMSQREQLVAAGLGFANVAIAAGAASTVERQQAAVLLAGLVASAVTVVGGRVGNRIVAILGLFACVVTRNANTFVFLAFGLPYYAAAMWMFLRYNRLVKEQAGRRRAQRAEARATAAPSSRRQGKGATADTTTVAKARPGQSKRYTPPKPAKKRPPPPPKPPRDRSIVD